LIKYVNNTDAPATKDKNKPIGYTPLNLFNSLSVVSGFNVRNQLLGFHIKLSPKIRNKPIGIRDKTKEKNIISIQILFVSYLCIFLKNKKKEINNQINNPIK
jgi:hypothetical protein